MDSHDLELRLIDAAAPKGEIGLAALAELAGSLQRLATRVGRHLAEQPGPGRTPASVERMTTLRLTGLGGRSTSLFIGYGDADALPLDTGFEVETADRFWGLLAAISDNDPPGWVTPGISKGAAKVCAALQSAAPRIELSQPRRDRSTTVTSATLDVDVWRRADRDVGARTVTGRLEAVDLKDRRFRIRDDVGNAIRIDDVEDAEQVGRLVGQRAAATGIAVIDEHGRLRLRETRVEAAPLPPEWTSIPSTNLEELIAAAPGPDPGGIPGLTDEEWEAFAIALRSQ